MDPQYGAYYRRLYESHWWWRMRERWVLQVLRRTAPPLGWRNILDIGCGDALFFDKLAPFGDVEGIEPDQNLVANDNPHRARITIGLFDASFQPLKRYGLILMLDVLEHLENPRAALQHVATLLAQGGNLILTVPAYKLVWTTHDDINHHITRYTKKTLFPILHDTGFRILESAYWYHWTFPVKLAQRVFEKALHLPPGNPGIPRPALNNLIMRVCAIEHAILPPLRAPFGTTLFARCIRRSNRMD